MGYRTEAVRDRATLLALTDMAYCGVVGVWIANDGMNTHEPCMIRPSGVRVNVPQPVIQLMTIIVVKSANSVTTTNSLIWLRRAIACACLRVIACLP